MPSNHSSQETAKLYLRLIAEDRVRLEFRERTYVCLAHNRIGLSIDEIVEAMNASPKRVRELLG